MSRATSRDVSDELLPEYDFSKGIRGKHHQAYVAGSNVVFLDPDVAAAFTDSASVNQALRLLMHVANRSVAARRPEKTQARTGSAPRPGRKRGRRR
jgi:hypothetical protein